METSLAVRAGGITKRFGDVVALDGIDLDVAPGRIHGLVGHFPTAIDVVGGQVLVSNTRGATRARSSSSGDPALTRCRTAPR